MWSDDLIKMTREVVSECRFVPNGDAVYFKNYDSRFGFIAVSDILGGKLLLIDRETSAEILYASIDELLDDGWAVD